MHEVILETPHAGQQLVINSKARFKVLMCGRRWGKTLVSQIIAVKQLLNNKKVALITPDFAGGQDFARDIMRYFSNDVRKALGIEFKQSEKRIITNKGGEIRLWSGENIGSIRGNKYHFAILDEAAKIPDLKNAWKGDIRPTLVDYQGSAIFISTPRGHDFFNALFELGQEKERGFESWRSPTIDNPYLPAGEWEEILADYADTPQIFNQEYMAIPMSNADNPLDPEDIEACTTDELSTKPTMVFGIDLGTKVDFTVITGLDGDGNMTFFKRFRKPWHLTHDELLQLPKDVLKVCDATGVGSAAVERLSQEMPNVKSFTFTTESKSKIMMALIGDIGRRKLKFNSETRKELMSLEQKLNPRTGHIRFAAVKGYHDDTIMSLAMANYHRIEAYGVTQWRPELI